MTPEIVWLVFMREKVRPDKPRTQTNVFGFNALCDTNSIPVAITNGRRKSPAKSDAFPETTGNLPRLFNHQSLQTRRTTASTTDQ
jgi:hypothetical protein